MKALKILAILSFLIALTGIPGFFVAPAVGGLIFLFGLGGFLLLRAIIWLA
jgi:hypothetical protein